MPDEDGATTAIMSGADPIAKYRDDPTEYCRVHNRLLALVENRAGGCFWCHPELAPPDAPKRARKVASRTSRR